MSLTIAVHIPFAYAMDSITAIKIKPKLPKILTTHINRKRSQSEGAITPHAQLPATDVGHHVTFSAPTQSIHRKSAQRYMAPKNNPEARPVLGYEPETRHRILSIHHNKSIPHARNDRDKPHAHKKAVCLQRTFFHHENIISHWSHATTAAFNKKFEKSAPMIPPTKSAIRQEAWEERILFLSHHVRNITTHPDKHEYFSYTNSNYDQKKNEARATLAYKNVIRELQSKTKQIDQGAIHRQFNRTFDNLAQDNAKEVMQLYKRIDSLDNR